MTSKRICLGSVTQFFISWTGEGHLLSVIFKVAQTCKTCSSGCHGFLGLKVVETRRFFRWKITFIATKCFQSENRRSVHVRSVTSFFLSWKQTTNASLDTSALDLAAKFLICLTQKWVLWYSSLPPCSLWIQQSDNLLRAPSKTLYCRNVSIQIPQLIRQRQPHPERFMSACRIKKTKQVTA